MIGITVRGDIKAITRDLNHLQRRVVPAATLSAINKTGAKIRTQVVRQVAADSRVPQKFVRRRIRLLRANRRQHSPTAVIDVWSMPILAWKLGKTRRYPGGIKARQFRFPNAFVARMRSGHIGIFKRKGEKHLPIKEQTVSLINAQRTAEHLVQRIGLREFPRIFTADLRWRLRRKGLI